MTHEHAWRMSMHLDGCHFYESFYSCECSASRHTWHERSVKKDPYSAVWMESRDCERCEALLGGARRRKHIDETVETVTA